MSKIWVSHSQRYGELQHRANFLLGVPFNLEDDGDMFLRNVH
jgi:hypothetical protein